MRLLRMYWQLELQHSCTRTGACRHMCSNTGLCVHMQAHGHACSRHARQHMKRWMNSPFAHRWLKMRNQGIECLEIYGRSTDIGGGVHVQHLCRSVCLVYSLVAGLTHCLEGTRIPFEFHFTCESRCWCHCWLAVRVHVHVLLPPHAYQVDLHVVGLC